jgi:hypothetical protein
VSNSDFSGHNDLAMQGGLKSEGGLVVAAISGIALLFSGYSLWETSLKSSDLQIFVPPVIYYSSPYNNSNFEMIQIPVTIVNEGAQTGTALHFDLEVTDPRTKQTKRFYSAEFGVWSMERTRQRAYTGFAPVSLQGHSSRAESVLFYTRGAEEKPEQLIREAGTYQFKLTLVAAEGGSRNWLSSLFGSSEPPSISFERALPFYDARSFQEGTIFMHSPDWAASSSGKSPPGAAANGGAEQKAPDQGARP